MQRLKIGDLVQVIAGKEKGKRGAIKRILKDSGRVIVEGLNMVVRHTRPSQQNTEGGRISKEASIHASNVMLVNAETDKPTRVKVRVEDGNKQRVAAGKNGGGAPLKQA
jgi:large subunit ribosomal protein L24